MRKRPNWVEHSVMGNERRTFERTDVAVAGQLQWQLKRRTGGIKTNSIDIRTLNLSIDGARVSTAKKTRLPAGASVRLDFNGISSPARVRGQLPDPHDTRRKILLLQFEEATPEFLQFIDRWVDAARGNKAFKSEYWKNHQAAL